MKVEFSAGAEADLSDIFDYIAANYPAAYEGFEGRLKALLRQIGRWPNAAPQLHGRAGVRMMPMMRYPYHLFYTVSEDRVVILNIRHGARQTPPLDPS